MGEQSHEGGGNSNHRKLPDQVEQHEAKPPKTRIYNPDTTGGQHNAAAEKSAPSRQFQVAEAQTRVPREPADSGLESAVQGTMTAAQLDVPSMNDGAVAFLKQARQGMDEVQKWSSSGELSLRGKTGEWMDHINKETAKWNAVISNVDRPEDAELLYDASVSFATLAQVNPEDPQALAKAADAAYAYFSRLLEKTKTPIVSDIGQLLESARHLFEFGREAFDPIRRQSHGSHQHVIRRDGHEAS
jgi:hypothetical protein